MLDKNCLQEQLIFHSTYRTSFPNRPAQHLHNLSIFIFINSTPRRFYYLSFLDSLDSSCISSAHVEFFCNLLPVL
ncbi:hypothetical protein DL98DRAFT_520995 [Cadophora sp. DSE1049]|nr:hypothetical protein DL98DRAFT_520995 [Cadophora sp. DSE1049]